MNWEYDYQILYFDLRLGGVADDIIKKRSLVRQSHAAVITMNVYTRQITTNHMIRWARGNHVLSLGRLH